MLPHARDPPKTTLGMSRRRPHNGGGHITPILLPAAKSGYFITVAFW
jgi:hypothetical protein